MTHTRHTILSMAIMSLLDELASPTMSRLAALFPLLFSALPLHAFTRAGGIGGLLAMTEANGENSY